MTAVAVAGLAMSAFGAVQQGQAQAAAASAQAQQAENNARLSEQQAQDADSVPPWAHLAST